ncbi:hypothetical protein K9M48_00330 [Candidatus Gracilibacteria bacterium]|nr:hypothetical protein [Candidatus Gracilibacteria bacterium]
MKLLEPNIEDRTFLIQFGDIVSEFGQEIPRLKKIENLKYFTDANVFKSELFNTLGIDHQETISPYILTKDDRGKEYIGGLLSFSQSPEMFTDPNNELVRQELESAKYAYITCLQIRDVLRGGNYGIELLSKAFEKILDRFEKVWGVVSKQELLSYYAYFGAKIENQIDNNDNLFLITMDRQGFKKRKGL